MLIGFMKYLALALLFVSLIAYADATPTSDDYQVGVAYHATTEDFVNTTFIKNYHDPEVRATVLQHLSEFASTTADTISTTLWFVSDPDATDPPSQLAWRLHFPPSQQELENIEQYVSDVKGTITKSGRPFDLQMRMGWLGCADFNVVNPDGTYGHCHYSWEDLIESTKTTIDNVLVALEGADSIDLVGDTWVPGNPTHQAWFLEIYPYFLEKSSGHRITGTFHSSIPNNVDVILDPNYTNQAYPEINGRGSLHNIYPTLVFLRENFIDVPDAMAITYYPLISEDPIDYEEVVDRVFSDFREILGKSIRIKIGESIYSNDEELRREMGLALAREAFQNKNLESFNFWTTPNAGPNGEEFAPPFGFDEYTLGNVYVEASTTCATCATVAWENPSLAQVWVHTDTKDSLLACAASGAVSPTWIQPNKDYLFTLHPATGCGAAGRVDYQIDSFLFVRPN